MLRLNSALVGVDGGDVNLFSDFENEGPMWVGQGQRQNRASVTFSQPYRRIPHVHVSLSMLDISNAGNARTDVQAENITCTGFEIVFRTWSDTRVARARVAWTSVGELPDEDDWDL
ncbi:H-type lectin domain-containing protein [Yoonia sp.]|uniref:H-type lectin domain-containing protein n=1 Tax=Yoonia sp. TaxID=2212373 RepID=UPI0019E68182|nr:H-type lectin domain-containing protein [Yoonia sp.]MBE0413654.1 H-type lectin domain-containing protein [Yoonia sp.]